MGTTKVDRGGGSRAGTVLIVDDDASIRQLLGLTFAVDGFEVVGEASNGLEAVALAVDRQPDLIVLDHQMPVMAGDEAARLLRALVPSARIVAFSAVLQSKPDWADAYLNKERLDEVLPLAAQTLLAVPAE